MKKQAFSLILILLTSFDLMAQTYVSGGIYSNESWVLPGSPYIVIGDLVLFPGCTLSIEPSVVVRFDDGVDFEVRGNLIAVGTESDSITFTSSSLMPNQGIWDGIFINNVLGGSAEIRFSTFKYADVGIRNICCSTGPPLNISRSTFTRNKTAISGYAAYYDVNIDSCYFSHNDIAITGAYKIVSNSTFVYNNYGFYQAEEIDLYNSNFCGNQVAFYGSFDELENNIIMGNRLGVKSHWGVLYIKSNNIIAENDTGVLLDGVYIGDNNIICDNLYYNLINNTSQNREVTNVCWCLTDSVSIAEKIYDGYDDPQLGLISFIPYISCNSSILPDTSYCPDIPISIPDNEIFNDESFTIYPNPSSNNFNVTFKNPKKQLCILSIYDLFGELIFSVNDITEEQVQISSANFRSGIYIIQLKTEDKILKNKKLIIN